MGEQGPVTPCIQHFESSLLNATTKQDPKIDLNGYPAPAPPKRKKILKIIPTIDHKFIQIKSPITIKVYPIFLYSVHVPKHLFILFIKKHKKVAS